MNSPMRYLVPRGPLVSGYAQAALQYGMALITAGQQFRLGVVGSDAEPDWKTAPAWARPIAAQPCYRPKSDPEYAAPINCLGHLTPDSLLNPAHWPASRKRIGLTVTETHLIPHWLAARLSTLDALIVPSVWNRDVFQASGVTCPVEVVPHTQGDYFYREVEAWEERLALRARGPWTFLYIGTWDHRKNPEAVLRAYLRAFQAGPDHRLVLKVSHNANIIDLIRAIVEAETGSTVRLEQDVQVISDYLNESQMAFLYATADCYVSAHRGEGWGIGPFQAALAGRQVIYTDWSAPPEYLTGSSHLPVTYKAQPAQTSGNASYFLGARDGEVLTWANPDIDHLIARLRQSARETDNPSMAETATLRTKYGWAAVGTQFKNVLAAHQRGGHWS